MVRQAMREEKHMGGRPTWMYPYLMLMPALFFVLLFKIYPMVSVTIGSFFRNGRLSLRTYQILFGDQTFWNSLWVTVRMNIIIIPL